MKAYRSTRQLLADVEGVLAASQPSFHYSPLEDVIELLCHGRHYAWVGIYLAVGASAAQHSLGAGSDMPDQVELLEARSKILISMKLASRELGVLSVESDRENENTLPVGRRECRRGPPAVLRAEAANGSTCCRAVFGLDK